MKRYILFSLLTMSFLFTVSCGEKDDPKPIVDPDDNEVNTWIYDTLYQHYLWYDDMPEKESLDFEADPRDFFHHLLSNKDGATVLGQRVVFSSIEKKEATTKAIEDNKPTYGFEYMLYLLQGSNSLFAQVLYVLPDSPAEEAGLKRGDIIISMGENENGITNPDLLDSGDAITLHVSRLNDDGTDLTYVGALKMDAARVVENNPFVKEEVVNYHGLKVGYLAYTHFDSGPNGSDDKKYDNQMKEIFARFKAQNLDHFVLDLRYNGGGLVSSAKLLASLLAPSNALSKVFCKMEYNDKNKNSNGSLSFDNSASVKAANLNLNKLYVITGLKTASSSEAIINNLIPYIGRENIVLVGYKTVGKTVGSNPYGEKDNYGYILRPITFRMTNADNNADYATGFSPDLYFDELDLRVKYEELGNPEEVLLKRALAHIAGEPTPRSEGSVVDKMKYKPLYSSLDRWDSRGMINDLD